MSITQNSESALRTPTGQALPRLLFPAVLAALGAWVVVSSTGMGFWVRLGPGPGFFPLVLGSLLVLLSLLWIGQEIRGGRHGATSEEPDTSSVADLIIPEEPHEPLRPKNIAAIVVSLAVLAALMPLVGFQLSMLFFLVFHLRVMGRRRWLLTALVSVVGSFGVFVLFTRVLTVNLPAASIGFLQSLGF
ncbi:tripartite tricarboxylate transporter TctB family protein [Pseudarthrobacter sp. NamE5]|uniref:tripartite tricarboxylate transporter TctB family protein n=1 Tax=Pseudarthrobacter sp. NamE5 TaxID=2576839 RepID=UPI00110A2465|nr:tripartite tricarboxylate transporter TctB family protein [Pseudarthrobacter sp. NamE5]TLM88270.1 tripartite tricarboxylate transporter TctB family protein [Pseudarthrobacter sp. NamE5]